MNLSKSWPYIEHVAKARLSHNKTDRHVSNYGDVIEIIGAAGELAARRYFGLSEKLHTEFDGGVDFIYRGLSIDVKSTGLDNSMPYKHLQWPTWKRVEADVVVLAAIDVKIKEAAIIGFAYGEEVAKAHVNDRRPYICYEIPVAQLRPTWQLMFPA